MAPNGQPEAQPDAGASSSKPWQRIMMVFRPKRSTDHRHAQNQQREAAPPPHALRLRRIWSEQNLTDGIRTNTVVNFSIRPQIDCQLITFLREKRLERDFPIRWLDHDSYEIVKNASRACLSHLKENYRNGEPQIYRTSAEAELLTYFANGESKVVGQVQTKHIHAWAKYVPIEIARYGAKNPGSLLQLRITWRFDFYDLGPAAGGGSSTESLAKRLRWQMKQNYETNYIKEDFLSRPAREAILTHEHIRELINKDRSLRDKFGPSEACPDRIAFVERVLNFGTRLLASCISAEVPLSRLHVLVCKAKYEDRHLPLRGPAQVPHVDGRNDWLEKVYLREIQKSQKIFQVYDFDKNELRAKMNNGSYEIIDEFTTIPILGPGKLLGQGAFGTVHEVSIHQEHHNFDMDMFALKQLHTPRMGVSTAFKQEHDVFSNIMKVEHPAILIPLAMWRKKHSTGPSSDTFCMLYPLGEGSLAEYLREHRERPKLTKDFVLHLMRQLLKIAEGLDAIHRLAPADLSLGDVGSASLRPPPAEHRLNHSVCHRDLKPGNIIIFHDGWKISDFGTSRILQIVSGKSSIDILDKELGDPEYGPPDPTQGTPSGRKYDIWSLGCIFLEILLTLFEEGTDDQLDGLGGDNPELQPRHRLDVFGDERLEYQTDDIGHIARYWYKEKKSGKYLLSPPVEKRLDFLGRRTQEYDQFDTLVDLVRTMLSIKPAHRPTAESVLGTLKTIDLQVRANLSAGHEDFYTRPGSHRIPFASQSNTDAGSQRNADQGGADPVRNLPTRNLDEILTARTSPDRLSRRTLSASSEQVRPAVFDHEDVANLVSYSEPPVEAGPSRERILIHGGTNVNDPDHTEMARTTQAEFLSPPVSPVSRRRSSSASGHAPLVHRDTSTSEDDSAPGPSNRRRPRTPSISLTDYDGEEG
ncbi:hypothetical protein H2204_000072 [Knufia peltigerae]|uniref:non-specific serine/threonine protein kinase n=1 Tax=Knufia peltigerae TaxID=1002370 RepID=A0AA38YFT6_9EURO|nr:hypothetical protein H2204_000072 [Knufia peltigerae]